MCVCLGMRRGSGWCARCLRGCGVRRIGGSVSSVCAGKGCGVVVGEVSTAFVIVRGEAEWGAK